MNRPPGPRRRTRHTLPPPPAALLARSTRTRALYGRLRQPRRHLLAPVRPRGIPTGKIISLGRLGRWRLAQPRTLARLPRAEHKAAGDGRGLLRGAPRLRTIAH